MFNRIHDWIKGVLVKMGLAAELQSVTDHKKVMADDTQYGLIAKWFSIYQSTPEWLKIQKKATRRFLLESQEDVIKHGTSCRQEDGKFGIQSKGCYYC
ncbi:hypothetical protein RO967_02595 [Lactiplantibacillus plantarum]|nr:hypothetical protein [Lactiplantibacillus plantarum]